MFRHASNRTQTMLTGRTAALIAVGLLLAAVAPSALAQRHTDRAGTAEFGFMVAEVDGVDVTGKHGAALSVDSDPAWGFTGGYNFTNRLFFGGEWTWASPSYVATRAPDSPPGPLNSIRANLDVSTFIVKAQFNFFEGAVTPYAEIGGGWIYVDSNIATGPPQTGCWWDPWWGYVCTSWYDTYNDTRTGWMYGLGVRWDVSDSIVLRGLWGQTDMKTNYASTNLKYDNYRVEVAWKF